MEAGALAGLRVLELTAGMAGPWIGRYMAWCGAEVIKVESREHPDVTRLYVPPRTPELGVQSQLSPWFTDWNAGKRFVSLDLTRPKAIEICKKLAAHCDVVVENYSSGVLDKLGLGYAALREARADVVMLSSTGFGASGPNRGYVTWGPNIEAISGSSTLSGFPQRECTITQYAYPDASSALHGLLAVLCALDHRSRTGEGQHIDLSQYETTVATFGAPMLEALAGDFHPARLGNRSTHAAPQGCYRCEGQDRWCVVSVGDDGQWRRLCDVIERPELATDARFASAAERHANHGEADTAIESWTMQRSSHDAMRALQSAGVAAAAVQSVDDQLRADPQLAARGFFEEIDHEKKGRVTAVGVPLGLTGTPGRTRGTGRAIGADNDYVFSTLLAMSEREIAACVADGAIETGGASATG
jgi:crotonobetainyl-CoA:carnitine CoA-transferase CaiB-like acyl-CoA transferase